LSLESRKSTALQDPGAEMLDQLTSAWGRYGRIVLGVAGALVVVGAVAWFTIQQNRTQENAASKRLAEADLYYWQQDYDRAKSVAQEVAKTWGGTPSGVDSHRIAGDAMYWLGDFKGAITEYRAYLARKGSGVLAASVRRSLGYALDSDKQWAEAAKAYDAVVGVFDRETSGEMLASAGRCLEAAGDKAGAIQRYQRIVNEYGETSGALAARMKLGELGATRN
jgi:tetratricopeptide (TPR) repeat protein